MRRDGRGWTRVWVQGISMPMVSGNAGSRQPERLANSPTGGARVTVDVQGVGDAPAAVVRRLRLTILDGPDAGSSRESASDTVSVGSHAANDLVLDDPAVSRFHCEVAVDAGGVRVRDLGSRNGTIVDGVLVVEAFLRSGSVLRLGRVSLRVDFNNDVVHLPLSARTEFGTLYGSSVAMRSCFAWLERVAASDATVLIEGETGTGKTRAAQAIHDASRRRERPFLVVDCGAIPASLIESQLFGHEKGAYTGADTRRLGAFEMAEGGTVLLDEVGELPIELQPKLLRVVEDRVVHRLGGNETVHVDVRVMAATQRDLRAAVNTGSFRPDLFYRLAVVRIILPPLRARREDVPGLVARLLESLGADRDQVAALGAPEFLARLQASPWPGNVRELRNHLERCLVLRDAVPAEQSEVQAAAADGELPRYGAARRQALAAFERAYIETILERAGGRVSEAARFAGLDRAYLYRMLKRHGLKG